MIEEMINKNVKNIDPYIAGATKEEIGRRHGLNPDQVIKLASNENPFGPSPKAVEAIKAWSGRVNLYPEDYPGELITAVSRYVRVSEDSVLPGGNGADEAMDVIIKMMVSPGDEVIVHRPTFPYYGLLTRLYGGILVGVPMTEDYGFPTADMIEKINKNTKLVVVCSPNNPTGSTVPLDDLNQLLETGVLVMLDEAYAEFTDQSHTHLVGEHENLIVLRTFSKAFGLAGLRVGYAVADPVLINEALKIKPPHNVNLLAQKAAIAALEDTDSMRGAVEEIRKQRNLVFNELSAVDGVTVYPSQANFHLIKIEKKRADEIVGELEKKGIMVRWCKAFDLPDCIRVTVGSEEENRAFLDEFKALTA